jgi:hypothetical protein
VHGNATVGVIERCPGATGNMCASGNIGDVLVRTHG